MIGRKVKAWGGMTGTVIKWEPLSAAMCDVLVRDGNGREIWFAGTDLRPVDGGGPLPSRADVRKAAAEKAISSLKAIRAQHVWDFDKPWPGLEHGKAIIGQAIDGAIKDLEKTR